MWGNDKRSRPSPSIDRWLQYADEGREYAVRNQYGYTEYHTAQAIANLREMGETVEVIDPAWGQGSTMYDRGARTGQTPNGAQGEFDARTGQGHSTQYYGDGYRLSRDGDGQNDDAVHWTDQGAGKHSPRRHRPPRDAR